MRIRVVPYVADHEEAVRAFNARLAEKNLDISRYSTFFPVSHVPWWLPKRPDCDLYQELFIAVDDDGTVRGGYVLKHQSFLVKGNLLKLAHYQLPISEGIIDRRFVSVGVRIYMDALQRQPHLFGLGGGGYYTSIGKFLVAAGWNTVLTPFWFRVVRPSTFLRNIEALRKSRLCGRLLDALACSGLGWVAVKTYQLVKGKCRCPTNVTPEVVPDFADWADDVWNRTKNDYSLIAVRDRQFLNLLYPTTDRRFTRLEIRRDGEIIGWAVLLDTRMSGHKQFGDMRVGTLVDCLAKPRDARDVAVCARDLLEDNGADLIVSNQGSRVWGEALRDCGFLQGPSNLPFFASPKLASLLEPFAANAETFHLNRGDGDGPINL
jgi:hypothetical protein